MFSQLRSASQGGAADRFQKESGGDSVLLGEDHGGILSGGLPGGRGLGGEGPEAGCIVREVGGVAPGTEAVDQIEKSSRDTC